LNLRWNWGRLGIGVRIGIGVGVGVGIGVRIGNRIGIGVGVGAGEVTAGIVRRVLEGVVMAVARLRGSGVGWLEEIRTSGLVLLLQETHLVE
jgi:hypothetical protein